MNILATSPFSWRFHSNEDVTTALLFMHAGSDPEAIAAELAARNVEVLEGLECSLLALSAANATLRDFEPLKSERKIRVTGTDPTLPWFGAAITDPDRFSSDLAQIVRTYFTSPATARCRRQAIFMTEPFWDRQKLLEFAWFMTFSSPSTLLVPVLEPRAGAVIRFARATGWDTDASRHSIETLEDQTLHLLDAFPERAIAWDLGIGSEGLDAVFPTKPEDG